MSPYDQHFVSLDKNATDAIHGIDKNSPIFSQGMGTSAITLETTHGQSCLIKLTDTLLAPSLPVPLFSYSRARKNGFSLTIFGEVTGIHLYKQLVQELVQEYIDYNKYITTRRSIET